MDFYYWEECSLPDLQQLISFLWTSASAIVKSGNDDQSCLSGCKDWINCLIWKCLKNISHPSLFQPTDSSITNFKLYALHNNFSSKLWQQTLKYIFYLTSCVIALHRRYWAPVPVGTDHSRDSLTFLEDFGIPMVQGLVRSFSDSETWFALSGVLGRLILTNYTIERCRNQIASCFCFGGVFFFVWDINNWLSSNPGSLYHLAHLFYLL